MEIAMSEKTLRKDDEYGVDEELGRIYLLRQYLTWQGKTPTFNARLAWVKTNEAVPEGANVLAEAGGVAKDGTYFTAKDVRENILGVGNPRQDIIVYERAIPLVSDTIPA